MKLDKIGKRVSKLFSFVLWSLFLLLYGGLYPPWVPEAPIVGKVWITAAVLILALGGAALAWLTEEE